VIVSYSTIEDIGAGFRSKLLMPRWKAAKERLREIEFARVPAIDARIIIGQIAPHRTIIGIEGSSLVVETRIPIDEFKQLSIRAKNDLVLDAIFESIKAAYAHFGDTQPPELEAIWQSVRAAA
jgi:hypothetical protein